MPSLPSNNNQVSDSEDEDYVPPGNEQESDSDASATHLEEDATALPKPVERDPEERKRKRDALWAEFLSKPPEPLVVSTTRTVKIEKKYRFAGDDVVEVVEVPKDSDEAKKWPLWKDPKSDSNPTSHHVATTSDSTVGIQPEANSNEATLSADSTTTRKSETQSEPSSSIVPKPILGKRPGPRKPKTILAPHPTSSKPKKITTLDKSAMDWRAHIQSEQAMGSAVKDELEAHRKAGGYLEKVEFLKRVEERKEENLDIMKSSKRRKL